MKSGTLVFLALLLSLLIIGSVSVSAQDDTFLGMTAEELFPGAIDETERDTAMAALLEANLPDARDRFAGQTLTVAVLQSGVRGVISGPLYYWRPVFEAVTGATLEIVELPFSELLTGTVADFLTGQNTYDAVFVGSWFYGDYISNGWIIPVDSYFGQEGYPQWDINNVAAPLRTLLQWGGQTYGVVNDGDAQLLYYRKDILEDPEWQAQFEAEMGEPMVVPPQTWQQLLKITQFFNGKDWNGDGDPDDGSSLHLQSGGQGFFHFMALSAPFAITPAEGDDPTAVTKYDNIYWFDPDDMTPLINQPGHVAALEYLQELAATGPEAQFGWDLGTAWDNFLTGNAIATFSWGDVGSLAEDPNASTIMGNLGAARIPCSDTWYDRETGEFVTDTENPNCVGNTIGGSWHGVISAASENQDLAYYLLAMQATPAIRFWNVTYGWTGIDPGTLDDLFEDAGGNATIEDYVSAGYNASDAEQFITAYGENLFSFPTTQTYLRIPGAPQYWEILDTRLAQAMTGQSSAEEALNAAAEEWDQVTNDLGREAQLRVYREAIGYQP